MDEDEAKVAPPPSTFADGIRFSELCALFEKVQTTSKAQAKIDLVFTTPLLRARSDGETLFPFMRLLLPQLDRERTVYGLKEKKLATMYAEILGLSQRNKDFQALKNYRDPTKVAYGARAAVAVGDFAMVLESVLKKREARSKHLTIGRVNEYLDELYHASDAKEKKAVLLALNQQCSAEEQKWIIRIILKDLKIGLKHERVLKYYHPDAMEAYNANTNLAAVCADPNLRDPRVRTKQQIRIMHPFRPMLCKRKAFKEGERVMGSSSFYIEDKMDGERMVFHKKGEEIQCWSRNCTDYSEYADNMRRYIIANVDADECILDGEMLSWDVEGGHYVPFGHNRTVVSEERTGAAKRHMCYVIFDILWLTGRPDIPEGHGAIVDVPLSRRKEILNSVITHVDHHFEILRAQVVCAESAHKRMEAIMERFNQAIDLQKEGIVLKESTSRYIPQSRDEKWVKLKPDYMEGFNETFDTIILGGYWGGGRRRSGRVSHFLLGLASTDRDETGENPTRFDVFTKVGSGYNMTELKQLQTLLEPHWVQTNKDRPAMPDYLSGWRPQKSDDVPDVLIRDPSKSVLLEVYGAELQVSNQFGCGHTLRFPRVVKIRHDKDWYECNSRQWFDKLLKERNGFLGSRKTGDGPVGWAKEQRKKRRRAKTPVRRTQLATVIEGFTGAVLTGERGSAGNLFADMEVCVLVDNYSTLGLSKPNLEKVLHSQAATIVQNPMDSTTLVIAVSDSQIRAKNVIAINQHDIVRPAYITACIEANARLPLEPKFLIHMCPRTKHELSRFYDEFGDHFWRETTNAELMEVFSQVDKKRRLLGDDEVVTEAEVAAALESLKPEERKCLETKFHLFKDCVVYVDGVRSDGSPGDYVSSADLLHSPLPLASVRLRRYHAKLVDSLNSSTAGEITHVVVRGASSPRLAQINELLTGAGRNPASMVVAHEWVMQCIRENRLVPVSGAFAVSRRRAGAGAGAGAGASAPAPSASRR